MLIVFAGIVTPRGEHLFTLRKEFLSFPRSWYLEGPNGEKFCSIDGRFVSLNQPLLSSSKDKGLCSGTGHSPRASLIAPRFSFGKAKLDVSFKNLAHDGKDVKLEVRGQFFDRSADITWDGKIVGKIRREFLNVREVFGGHQTYGVEVAPGVDLALISAVVIAIDEQRNEKK